MADNASQPKAPGRAAENTLNLLATIGGLGGSLIFGPDFKGDLGAPFRAGAGILQQQREAKALRDALGVTEPTRNLLDHADALHEAGGVANNMDLLNHPELQDAFSLGKAPALLNTLKSMGPSLSPPQLSTSAAPPSSLPNPSMLSGPASAPAPAAQPNPASIPTAPGNMINPASPDFLQRLSVTDPEMAREIVMDRAKQHVSPLDDMMKMLGIQNFQTPQQKADREVQTAIDKETALTPMREAEKQKEKQAADNIKNSQFTDKEATGLRGKDIAIADLQNLINSGDFKPNPTLSAISKIPFIGPAMTGAINPKFREMQKQLDAIATDVMAGQPNQKGGVRMLGAIKLHLPTDSEISQGLGEQIAKDNIARIKEAKYQQLATSHPQRPIQDFADPQTVQDYKTINQIEQANPQKAAQDPRIQSWRKQQGLSYNRAILGEK